MKYKICILICYFGKLPSTFNIWRKSCNNNSDIDFLLFTDQAIEKKEDNLQIYNCSLADIKELAKSKLELEEIELSSAYKLCDYKAMYGVIFSDYLKGYDFWGICDMDMIFGKISDFLSNEILEKYDKIYQLGHLTLYRNAEEVNNRFKIKGYCDWKEVVAAPTHFRLCERGMMRKYELAGIPVYKQRDYADISKIHKRYQLSHWLVPKQEKDKFKYQLFYSDRGHIFRCIYVDKKLIVEEFNYIHLQKRKIAVDGEIGDCFYISSDKLIPKKPGVPKVDEILKLNPYISRGYEIYECIIYEIKTKNIFKRYISRIFRRRKG